MRCWKLPSRRPSPKFLLVHSIAINVLIFLLFLWSLPGDVIKGHDVISMRITASAVHIQTGFNVTSTSNVTCPDMNLPSHVGPSVNGSWKEDVNRSSEAFRTLKNFKKRCHNGTIQRPFSVSKSDTKFLCPCVPAGLRK